MTCALCSLPICGHPDPIYAGIVPPRHSPSGRERAGASTASQMPDAGPATNTLPHSFQQPTTGAAAMRHHRQERAPLGEGAIIVIGANGDEARTHVAAQYPMDFAYPIEFTMFFNPTSGQMRGEIWL